MFVYFTIQVGKHVISGTSKSANTTSKKNLLHWDQVRQFIQYPLTTYYTYLNS